MIHSVEYLERIFWSEPAPVILASIAGRRVLVEEAGPGRVRVRQLLSTDPRDFLDSRWLPGAEHDHPGAHGARGPFAP